MSLMCTQMPNGDGWACASLTQQAKKLQKRNHGACECGEDRNRLDEPASLECRNAPLCSCSLLEGCRPGQRSAEGLIAQKRRNRVEENPRSGFIREKDVVPAVERNESGARNPGGDFLAQRERHSHVTLAMGDQRRRLHLRQEVGDVDLGELDHESPSFRASRRPAPGT